MKKVIFIIASFAAITAAKGQSRCVTAPVELKDNKVTVVTSGEAMVKNEHTYIYYTRNRKRKNEQLYNVPNVHDSYPSKPLLVSYKTNVAPVPEAYKVSVNVTEPTVSVCPDSTLVLDANINVERVHAYTGNYPEARPKVYQKVSRHSYRVAARKMRKIKNKESKVAKRLGSPVEVMAGKAVASK